MFCVVNITTNTDIFYKANWYFPNIYIFCFISGEIQHIIFGKVSYINTKNSKTKLYHACSEALFFLNFSVKERQTYLSLGTDIYPKSLMRKPHKENQHDCFFSFLLSSENSLTIRCSTSRRIFLIITFKKYIGVRQASSHYLMNLNLQLI